ncbi:hypothetical protein CC78DRAFT_68487 [Lojkania enalia]|uniref:Secreted protein n=1 Tax=Lojkania enalia TaxID=147567 RepID=A0A9P4K184_9PLEO|nr:hypothetical protein CC78DRAFT_68487 [Didymosphaeria enalia]
MNILISHVPWLWSLLIVALLIHSHLDCAKRNGVRTGAAPQGEDAYIHIRPLSAVCSQSRTKQDSLLFEHSIQRPRPSAPPPF